MSMSSEDTVSASCTFTKITNVYRVAQKSRTVNCLILLHPLNKSGLGKNDTMIIDFGWVALILWTILIEIAKNFML